MNSQQMEDTITEDLDLDTQSILTHLHTAPISSAIPGQEEIEEFFLKVGQARKHPEYQKLLVRLGSGELDRDGFFKAFGLLLNKLDGQGSLG